MKARSRQVLAIASGGGHFIQLLRLRPAFAQAGIRYVTTLRGYEAQVAPDPIHVVRDANRNDKLGLIVMSLQIAWLIVRYRPRVIVSTGAAPGYAAIRLGRLLGARTCWVDSIANAEEMSMSGRKLRGRCDMWLTQWQHLSDPAGGPAWAGSVLGDFAIQAPPDSQAFVPVSQASLQSGATP